MVLKELEGMVQGGQGHGKGAGRPSPWRSLGMLHLSGLILKHRLREEGSGWGTHVYLWRIHFDIWQI